MMIFRNGATALKPADAASFVGSARTKLLASADEGSAVHVYRVEFDSGARTNWHSHSGPQWLLVVDGQIRAQVWGESHQDVGPGDAVLFAPGEKHWHGAVPGSHGVHLAVNINAQTEWLEPVTDRIYHGDDV